MFFSLLLYLNKSWPRNYDAETLFLDSATDTGVIVRPKPGRAVLMDQASGSVVGVEMFLVIIALDANILPQDILHRLSVPSRDASQPRYSLVFKLVMVPRREGAVCSLSKPEWGRPTAFGSAARAERLVEQAAKRRRLELLAAASATES